MRPEGQGRLQGLGDLDGQARHAGHGASQHRLAPVRPRGLRVRSRYWRSAPRNRWHNGDARRTNRRCPVILGTLTKEALTFQALRRRAGGRRELEPGSRCQWQDAFLSRTRPAGADPGGARCPSPASPISDRISSRFMEDKMRMHAPRRLAPALAERLPAWACVESLPGDCRVCRRRN